MASVFRKGAKWWARLKGAKKPGKWGNVPTPYKHKDAGSDDAALRYAEAAQKAIDLRARAGLAPPLTVAVWALAWIEGRKSRIATWKDELGHVNNWIVPKLGDKQLGEVHPSDAQDFAHWLQLEAHNLAPKTVINVCDTLRRMFKAAVIRRKLTANPIMFEHGDLPAKVDKDPEWRQLATYATPEVVALVSDPRLPAERRVQYALKALAGMRHGEVAGIRWRNRHRTEQPLPKLVVSRSYEKKRTKTEVTREIPEHPLLTRILDAWAALWKLIYGRPPLPDDLIVPARSGNPVRPRAAVKVMKHDLLRLGLRLDAGEQRDRGGHDLRAWFITHALDGGASSDALQRVTHTKKKDVVSGYTRLPWRALCDAVLCLKIDVDGDPLALAPGLATGAVSLLRRWGKVATPTGFEPVTNGTKPRETGATARGDGKPMAPCDGLLVAMGASLVTDPEPR